MGSGHWFKAIIGRKKWKNAKLKQLKGIPSTEISNKSEPKSSAEICTAEVTNGNSSGINGATFTPKEDNSVIQIQTAIRAFLARKSLHKRKGAVRLQKLTKTESVTKQATNTLSQLHSWGRIQAQIKERRLCMVVEGRLTQKKLENQQKLEAKLHDVEVEWCDGSNTMEEILLRIHHREEAAVKRERALAYAFTHQWRANNKQNQGIDSSDVGKAGWGWSWKERWIAARPWENRATLSPNRRQNKQTSKANSNTNALLSNKSLPIKPNFSNGNAPMKPQKLSFSGPGEVALEANARDPELAALNEQRT